MKTKEELIKEIENATGFTYMELPSTNTNCLYSFCRRTYESILIIKTDTNEFNLMCATTKFKSYIYKLFVEFMELLENENN